MLNSFLENLQEKYPEKYIILLGINYSELELQTYLKENLLNIDTFSPLKFKKFLSSDSFYKTTGYFNANATYNVGDIVFDQTTNDLKVYDGSMWKVIVTS